jgi:hypothetical protein
VVGEVLGEEEGQVEVEAEVKVQVHLLQVKAQTVTSGGKTTSRKAVSKTGYGRKNGRKNGRKRVQRL